MGFGMDRHTWEQIKSCKEVRHYTNTIVEVLMLYLLHFSSTFVRMMTTTGTGPLTLWGSLVFRGTSRFLW